MRCDILLSTVNGQIIIGNFELVKNKIEMHMKSGYEKVIRSLLLDPVRDNGKLINRDKEPEKWLRALPGNYSGSYLRASLK